MQEAILICRICGNIKQNKTYAVREMMFGFRDVFEYFECPNCGCLQMRGIPNNLSKFYPENYYAFTNPVVSEKNLDTKIYKKYCKDKRNSYVITKKGIIGRFASIIKPPPQFLIWLRRCNATFDSKILDIGCGTGHLLLQLRSCGFKNLMGLDPNIKNNIIYNNDVRVIKKQISTLENKYDVIMFHHSFEHIFQPLHTLKDIYMLLNENGYVLIRIPTTSSYAWKHYGINWVQIDAPRHTFLYSLKGIEILAHKSQFKIKEIIFDSTNFQFWGSEQYLKDIPLLDMRSYFVNHNGSIFSDKEIELFKKKANKLNREKLGDQVCIYLTKH